MYIYQKIQNPFLYAVCRDCGKRNGIKWKAMSRMCTFTTHQNYLGGERDSEKEKYTWMCVCVSVCELDSDHTLNEYK